MRFYADVCYTRAPDCLVAELRQALERIRSPGQEGAGARSAAIEAWREAMICAGLLEQALVDQLQREPRETRWAKRLQSMSEVWTSYCADGLAAALGSRPYKNWPPPSMQLLHSMAGQLGTCQVTIPEGYLFYALFPEQYLRLGSILAQQLAPGAVVVIGLRSIGTSLSAAVAAGLRCCGRSVARHTVRPTGDPLARELIPSTTEAAIWRQALARGSTFVVVDEGPGLSGSSLASVVATLEGLGAAQGTVHMVCASPPGAMPLATDATRDLWQRTPYWPAIHAHGDFWQTTMAEMLSAALGLTGLRLTADLSWGGWAAQRRTAAGSLWPQVERRKLLLENRTHQVFAKFIGFGAVGRLKAQLARRLSEAGMAPAYLGYAHGLLAQEWHNSAMIPPAPPIEEAATYYAYLRRNCTGEAGPPLPEVAETVQSIARSWFGEHVPGDCRRLLPGLTGAGLLPLQGDQRPERTEWLHCDGRVMKGDAADHFLDHSWAREQDICFDLAGFAIDHDLSVEQERILLQRYQEQSGDGGALSRLPFYRCVYAAHRLAMLDTGYHAAGEAGRASLEAVRSQAGEALARALRHGEAQLCAS